MLFTSISFLYYFLPSLIIIYFITPKKYKNIIENQLGNVIIVDSLDDANKIGKKTDYKYKIVSLEGDILYSGGAVSGGRVNTNNDDKLNLLHMQNEYNDKKGLLQSMRPAPA